MSKYIGTKLGRYTAINSLTKPDRKGKNITYFTLRCECGTETIKRADKWLYSGEGRMCRECYLKTQPQTSITRLPEWHIWDKMVARCYRIADKDYKKYGAKGVRVCPEWLGDVKEGCTKSSSGFRVFLQDMGPRPSPRHSLDRYPNRDGDYTPKNCRWATIRQQNNNRRNCLDVTLGEVTMTARQWSNCLGLKTTNWYQDERGRKAQEYVTALKRAVIRSGVSLKELARRVRVELAR